MKIFYFLCLFSATATATAFAQDNLASIPQTKAIYGYGNSFHNRQDKKFLLTANLIGVAHNLKLVNK